MFTGIVMHRGVVRKTSARNGAVDLRIDAPQIARELKKGDSVSLNGVCLTATEAGRRSFSARAVDETLVRTTLARLAKGDAVNLELPLRVSDRIGGHLVQGHVDGTARVSRIEEEEGARRVWFSALDEQLRYVVPKGSVALDGVSLTVVEVGRTTFQVVLIPHTLAETTLSELEVGSEVNLEVDLIGKYVERLVRKD